MATRVIRLFDPPQVAEAAAEEFMRMGNDAIKRRSRFTVVFSGGSTPRQLYQLLAAPPQCTHLDWTKIECFWGDERPVPPDHPDSNFRMVREALLDVVNVPPSRIHRIVAERTDRIAAAHEYATEMARVFGVAASAAPPAFDLILLGMGPDGHTASLFPHTAAVHETARWVMANPVPTLGTERITLTAPLINRAAAVLFLVVGADKAVTLAEVLEGPRDPARLPAQLIQPVSGTVTWLVDALAANQLTGPGAQAIG